MRLLVVEDEPRLAADLKAAFEAAGMPSMWLTTARPRISASRRSVRRVILDLGLPRIDGLTFSAGGGAPARRCRSCC